MGMMALGIVLICVAVGVAILCAYLDAIDRRPKIPGSSKLYTDWIETKKILGEEELF
jgi:hypothetical protein